MRSREASATKAPTAANPMQLIKELQSAFQSGGVNEPKELRESRMYGLFEARRDEITMTLMLMLPIDGLAYLMNNSLLGMRFNKDAEKPELGMATPLHPQIELQSLRKACPQCEGDACGRKGKYHDVTYKTATKSGTGADHRLITAMGGTVQDYVLCRVDPETGRFSLPPLEAKKALREWGENAIRVTRRWVDRLNKKGDRWKIREVRHHELYANAAITGALPDGVQPMTAD